MQKSIIFFLCLSWLTFSCNDDDDANENLPSLERGTAQVTITGGFSNEYEGHASFTHEVVQTQAAEGSQLQILILDEENPDEYLTMTILVREDMDGMDPGTYQVNQSSAEAPFVTIYYTTENGTDYIATNTGTITVDGINDDAVWGSFSAKLVEIQNSTLNIEGTFHAQPD